MDKAQFEQCREKLRELLYAEQETIQPPLSSPPQQCSKSPIKPHNQPTDTHEGVCKENDESRMDADVGNAPVAVELATCQHEHQHKQPTEQSSQSLPPCSKPPLKPHNQPSDTHAGVDEDNGVDEENDKNRMDTDVGNAPVAVELATCQQEHQQKQPTVVVVEQSKNGKNKKSSKSPLKPQVSDIHEGIDEENVENRMDADIGNAPVVEDKAIVVVKQEYADTEEGMDSANVDDGIKFISHTNYLRTEATIILLSHSECTK